MSSHYVSVLQKSVLKKKSKCLIYVFSLSEQTFFFPSFCKGNVYSQNRSIIAYLFPAPFLFRPLRWFYDCPFGYLLVCRKFEQFLLESSDLMFSIFLRQTNFLFIFASVSRIFTVFVAILVVFLLILGQRLASRNTAAIVHTLFPPWADRSFEWRLLANRRAR